MNNIKYVCHDCDRELVENEEYVAYSVGDKTFIKCRKCHEADPCLRDYQITEVYSRVVGYIRPVSQYNLGKQQEFKDRAVFKFTNAKNKNEDKNKKDTKTKI